MKIYIPDHLKSLKIIEQMDQMIKEYSSKYYTSNSDSFNDYYYSLMSDPVKKFVSLCISKDSINESQDYEEVINYISKLFYSVKGTIKVFDYMKTYLGLVFEGDLVYSTQYIEFKLSDLTLSDENLFYESLTDFLDALLYYRELRINIDSIDLDLTGDINNFIGATINKFNEITAIPYEDNN